MIKSSHTRDRPCQWTQVAFATRNKRPFFDPATTARAAPTPESKKRPACVLHPPTCRRDCPRLVKQIIIYFQPKSPIIYTFDFHKNSPHRNLILRHTLGPSPMIDGKYGEFFYRGRRRNGVRQTPKRLRKETFGQINHISVASQAVVMWLEHKSPRCTPIDDIVNLSVDML